MPFAQAALVELLASNWTNVTAHLAGSSIALTRPILRPDLSLRSTTLFADRSRERVRRLRGSRYVLRSDVSECYSSIYTHSVEWALHGKVAVKANLYPKPPRFGGLIDKAIQHGQEKQTKGIPTGPSTSFLIAEAVLTAIDADVQARCPSLVPAMSRFIDDFELFCATQGEAEDVLLAWQSALAKFELQVNPTKTVIEPGPGYIEEPWHQVLNQYRFRRFPDTSLAGDLRGFFSLAYGLAREYPLAPVLAFAIARAIGEVAGPKSWEEFHILALAFSMVDPSSLRFVCSVLGAGISRKLPMDLARVEETMNAVVAHHARQEHGSEVTWALWTLYMLGLPLDSRVASVVAEMDDNCALLLLLALNAAGRITGPVPSLSHVVARAEAPDALETGDWLLGYEAVRHGWAAATTVSANPAWAELLGLNVAFLVLRPTAGMSAAVPVLGSPSLSVLKLTAAVVTEDVDVDPDESGFDLSEVVSSFLGY